jgi:hypothetical protein
MHPNSSSSSSDMGFSGRLGDAPQEALDYQTQEAQTLFARLLLAVVISGALRLGLAGAVGASAHNACLVLRADQRRHVTLQACSHAGLFLVMFQWSAYMLF